MTALDAFGCSNWSGWQLHRLESAAFGRRTREADVARLSPWPSAPNVRFFANAAQVRRLGLIAAFARRSASQSSVLARAVGDAKAVDEHV